MKRKITAVGKNASSNVVEMRIVLSIKVFGLVNSETKSEVQEIKNELNDFLRKRFNQSDIKIS